MQTLTKQSVISFYLEYVNNFLSINRMADYYDLPAEDCGYLISLGKKYHEAETISVNVT